MTRLVSGAVMMLQNSQHMRYKTMSWPEYMAQLLNRLTALTDPKAVVTLKAGDHGAGDSTQHLKPEKLKTAASCEAD